MTLSRSMLAVGLLVFASEALAIDGLDVVPNVEQQPFVAATGRLIEALKYVGAPLRGTDVKDIEAAMKASDPRESVTQIQHVLDRLCLAVVTINPESRVSVIDGPADPLLVEQGWRTFLVKVINEAGVTAPLKVDSPQAGPVYGQGKPPREKPQSVDKLVTTVEGLLRFLGIEQFSKQPLKPQLSGLLVEYRILQLYSRDAGPREATLTFDVGQGTQDLGFRSELPVLFECHPSMDIKLGVFDEDGQPTTAAFVIRDEQGRVYPNPARRLAPDFFFHEQIYRANDESVRLPAGTYTVTVSRGPEYVVTTHQLKVSAGPATGSSADLGGLINLDGHGSGNSTLAEFRLHRWIHPLERGWVSGDHHVHAAGCKHYDSPTEGVSPEDMLRHIVGEDLNVGCVLSWGPCWYTQKQFFEGKTSELSRPTNLMRYDVEVSGFPSSHCGHLCLLRLTEDDYPGTTYLEQWPSWTQPVLQWGQKQGGVVGYSHSGWGLALPDYGPNGERFKAINYPQRDTPTPRAPMRGRAADRLPDYAMPPFDGIGANEFVVTTANNACDFISTVDTPAIWELNVWYHTMNCGMTTRISGETDFPCIYGDKVGLGRIYVKSLANSKVSGGRQSPLNPLQPLDYDDWVEGLKNGRSYVTDGLSHILDFRASAAGVTTVNVGEPGSKGAISRLDLANPGQVKVAFDVAALLEEKPSEATERIRHARLDAKPYWHIERCRIGDTRTVPVEIIVNGQPVARREIEADGGTRELTFDVPIERSSWVAARILPSVHTNPIWVVVDNQPVRASKRSAEWCRQAVEVCWNSKRGKIREPERAAARAAYDAAGKIYDQIIAESKVE